MDLPALQSSLDGYLNVAVHVGTDDQNGVFLPSELPVRRFGLALEPFAGLERWVKWKKLDALFLHRPWRMGEEQRAFLVSRQTGVLAYHLAFDERLTTGFNPALAEACGWGEPELFGTKEGRPLGMTCLLPTPTSFEEATAQLEQEFSGLEAVVSPSKATVQKVAVVGAMTEPLIRQAHEAGVSLYVTGQLRHPARLAVQETGIGVVALGHHRSEVWGLRHLARYLQSRLAGEVQVFVPEVL